MTTKYPLLETIDTPADLRKLDEAQLPAVAEELRNFLIDSVAAAGGHFGAGLGCVVVLLRFLFLSFSSSIPFFPFSYFVFLSLSLSVNLFHLKRKVRERRGEERRKW